MLSEIYNNTFIYILVFVRMAGMLAFNPLLSRRNMPSMVRVGLILLLTLILAPGVTAPGLYAVSNLDMFILMLKELVVGIACGFVFQIFYYMLFFVGDLMDVQFGMSMARVFDPGTNVQMSISGNILTIVFILFLFATDSHLILIRIFATSFDVVGLGAVVVSREIGNYLLQLTISVFNMAIRLALPFVAAEFILEMSMGILMKLIPQIHVFVINIQFKMFLGITLLLLFAGPIASFLDNYMRIMMETIQSVLFVLT